MGDGPTRDTQDNGLSARKEDMKEGLRAWISGGCVPLVQVSPISARTDGVQGRGMGRGSLGGRSGWPGRFEDSDFEESCSLESSCGVVSSFHPVCRCTRLHPPFPMLCSPPLLIDDSFPHGQPGSLSDGVYASGLLRWYTQISLSWTATTVRSMVLR